jgi:hypothetical protein
MSRCRFLAQAPSARKSHALASMKRITTIKVCMLAVNLYLAMLSRTASLSRNSRRAAFNSCFVALCVVRDGLADQGAVAWDVVPL